jgi:hypothetical protein
MGEILIVEFEPIVWDTPRTFSPLGNKYVASHSVIYDLVGKGFFYSAKKHFTAQFQKGNVIFNYDDLHNGGHAVRVKGAKMDSHLSGEYSLSDESCPCSVVYTL